MNIFNKDIFTHTLHVVNLELVFYFHLKVILIGREV